MVNITIPEGFQIASVPENMHLPPPNDMGSFSYNIVQNENKLQVVVKINQAIIPASDYSGIKELYKNIFEKETEKVVLSKI